MPSIFFGLNIAKSGLQTSQKAMDVTGQNIANANTPGYSRQEAVLQTTTPYTLPFLHLGTGAGQLGSGVEVSKVTRARDNFLEQQIRNETNNLGFISGQKDIMQRVETAFLEPSEHGISNLLDQFWNGWQELSKNPENLSMRTNLVEKAITLTESINQVYGHLEHVYGGITAREDEVKGQIIELVENIGFLNDQIITIKSSGQEPNDLMDRRDSMLEELAKFTDFSVTEKTNGGLDIGITITTDALGDKTFTVNPKGVNKGELDGLAQARTDLNAYLDKINEVAYNLTNTINGVVDASGNSFNYTDSTGSIPTNFFEPIALADKDNAAKLFKVNAALIVNPSIMTNGNTSKDGEYALAISKLRHQTTMDGGKATFEESWQDLVVGVGSKTKELINREANQGALMTHLNNRREEISGVSIDEELVNMVKYQYAFQASSKMITVLDEMLDTLINRMGR